MATNISKKALAAVIASGVVLPLLMWGRSYPWQLAAPVAIAVGLLVYSTLSTVTQMRSRRPPSRKD
ncbi:MAG: hypothetical protein K0U98_20870 [Deltaproteobacteria bacterium]|nr:hypothetical protein [Deltaproteobacteria bacterium]